MATKTSTAVSTLVQPRMIHAGTNVARAVFTGNALTVSAGDVIQMVKIPRNAAIVELLVGGHSPNSGLGITVGDGSLSNRFVTAVSLSSTSLIFRMNNPAGLGYVVSLSDDATTEYDTIDITIQDTTSATASCSIVLEVFYVAPGQV